MIICSCEGVSDKTIRGEIERGARSVGAVVRGCGAGRGCGQCLCDVKQLLRNGRDASQQATNTAMIKLAS